MKIHPAQFDGWRETIRVPTAIQTKHIAKMKKIAGPGPASPKSWAVSISSRSACTRGASSSPTITTVRASTREFASCIGTVAIVKSNATAMSDRPMNFAALRLMGLTLLSCSWPWPDSGPSCASEARGNSCRSHAWNLPCSGVLAPLANRGVGLVVWKPRSAYGELADTFEGDDPR